MIFYIIDGLDMVFLKNSIRFKLIDQELNFKKLMPIKAFRTMPLKLLIALKNDIAYANDPYADESNFLNNRLLWGGTIGLDIVVFYDKVFSLEYSFNHLWEKGLFLQLNLNL